MKLETHKLKASCTLQFFCSQYFMKRHTVMQLTLNTILILFIKRFMIGTPSWFSGFTVNVKLQKLQNFTSVHLLPLSHTNHIAREFWFKHLLYVCANLHVPTTTSGSKVINTSYLTRKPEKQVQSLTKYFLYINEVYMDVYIE